MQVFDPTVLCNHELKLCSSQNRTSDSLDSLMAQLNLPSKLKVCNSCLKAVETIDKLLQNGEIDYQISKLVRKACSRLRGASKIRVT